MPSGVTELAADYSGPVDIFTAPDALENGPAITAKPHATRRHEAPVVMLHLRSCYVSKAAILTIPIPLVSVENRSPA
ncbi:MAG TPA: hypothetical protein VK804_17955 [Bradyrhizobium sp.]|uniref:hypothetical protein n=1 Tax=Bradyrhizobium sp. TaxID=376 RepID=UPI002BDEC304|nr:hypothetical protein [Bradyrhizobium sp.]HTB02355.1 hypothetical protein [Bradyrhizobium sp.]